MGMGGQHHAPATLPQERDLVPIVQEAAVVPRGQSGQARKILPSLGFNPRTAQPVAGRYMY
jgi:hypothetical protein